jgi:hypothetical protein
MLPTRFFNTPEGDLYAKFKATSLAKKSKYSPKKNTLDETNTNINKKIRNTVFLKENTMCRTILLFVQPRNIHESY